MNDQPPSTPEVIIEGKYRVEKKLGEGGFSKVYKATQKGINRKVAVKVMKATGPARDDDEGLQEELIERFRREAEVISQLRSPATVTVHDYGRTQEDDLYMVLEYVDGRTLIELAPDLPMDATRMVRILEQILDSLGEAHHFGILHRDIKPGNIMVYEHMGEADHVKVLDFGIAKILTDADTTVEELTQAGILVGTPRYIAPELAKGTNPCPASDLYSVGLVCYELLTGQKGVPGASTMEVLSHQLDPTFEVRLPADVEVPESLRTIIDKMLAKSVDERYASAFEVLEELKGIQDDLASWQAGEMEEMATRRLDLDAIDESFEETPPDVPNPSQATSAAEKSAPEAQRTSAAKDSTTQRQTDDSSDSTSSRKLVLGVIVVALLAGAGYFATSFQISSEQAQADSEQSSAPQREPAQPAAVASPDEAAQPSEEPAPTADPAVDEQQAEPSEQPEQPEEAKQAEQAEQADDEAAASQQEAEEPAEREPQEGDEQEPEPEDSEVNRPVTKKSAAEEPAPEPSKPDAPKPDSPKEKDNSSRTVEMEDGVKKVIENVDGPLFDD